MLLPAHWQTAAVLLAGWWCGAELVTDPIDADLVLCDGDRIDLALAAMPASGVVALSLDAFGKGLPGLPAGVVDFATEVRLHGDDFVPWAPLPDDAPALVGSTVAGVFAMAQARAVELHLSAGDRVLSTLDWNSVDELTDGLLAVLAAGASLVQCRNADPAALPAGPKRNEPPLASADPLRRHRTQWGDTAHSAVRVCRIQGCVRSAQQRPGHHHPLDLGGALVDLGDLYPANFGPAAMGVSASLSCEILGGRWSLPVNLGPRFRACRRPDHEPVVCQTRPEGLRSSATSADSRGRPARAPGPVGRRPARLRRPDPGRKAGPARGRAARGRARLGRPGARVPLGHRGRRADLQRHHRPGRPGGWA